jgi:hypothetical protein
MSRARLAAEYLGLGLPCVALASLVSFWAQGGRDGGEAMVMLLFMPFGMALPALFVPEGWFFWAGFGLALTFRSRWFLCASVLASLEFGLLWPRIFWGMMSV